MGYVLVQQVKQAAVHAAAVDVQGKCLPDKLAPFWKLEMFEQ